MNQLGNCIHYKDGKYRLWSSFTDSFLTNWTQKKEIYRLLLETAIEDDKRILEERFSRAEKKGCSIRVDCIRHGDDEL